MALKGLDERLLVLIRLARRSSILRVLPRGTRLCGRPLGACRAPHPSHARSSFFHPFSPLPQHIADCLAIFPISHNPARRLLDCYIRIQLGWISIYRQCSSPDCHFRSSIFDFRFPDCHFRYAFFSITLRYAFSSITQGSVGFAVAVAVDLALAIPTSFPVDFITDSLPYPFCRIL